MEHGFWRRLTPWQWTLGLVGLALAALGYWVGISGNRPYLLLVLPGFTLLATALWSSRRGPRFPFHQRKKWRFTLFVIGMATLVASFVAGVFNESWTGWAYFPALVLVAVANPIWDEVFWDEPKPEQADD